MAIVTERLIQIEGIGWVDITYDDALALGGDISACDLVSVTVNIEAGRTAKVLIQRGDSSVWQSRSATGPLLQTFNAGGPVQQCGDLNMFVFGGDE